MSVDISAPALSDLVEPIEKEQTEERRRFKRFPASSLRLEMDGREWPIINISSTGVLISGGEEWLREGQRVVFYLIVPIRDEISYARLYGKITRKNEHGIAIRYESPAPEWKKMLTSYLRRHNPVEESTVPSYALPNSIGG